MSANKYLLQVRDVYKQYGDRMVLDNIDLAVRDGELCTVVGPSGCGKSTLLRLILGQEPPSSGRVLIDDRPVGHPDPARGIVYQRYSLFPNLTVLENVTLGRNLAHGFLERRRRRREFEAEAMEYLARVKLAEHAHKYPHALSGGMQQRAAIAQALIMKHRILMMDEPFGALDPQTREDMQLFLLELWERERMTVFFVTHDLEEALFLGSRLFVLSQYYTDDRGDGDGVNRGSKIVADYHLPQQALSRNVKDDPEFHRLMAAIRQDGFDPAYLQHVAQFNLRHPDSYQTLTETERNHVPGGEG
jgi:NitT/TauT family transport system ATP-binding protein